MRPTKAALLMGCLLTMVMPAWSRGSDAGEAAREPVNVFEATRELATPDSSHPAVVRSRRIRGALTGVGSVAAGDRARFELFDDVVIVAVIDEVVAHGRGRAISGRIESRRQTTSAGVFSAIVDDGLLSAVVETGRRVYRVRSRDAMTHVIEEIDATAWPACATSPMAVASDEHDDPPMGNAGLCDEDGSRLDLLVLYTPNAMNAAGGADAITNEIALAVSVANTAYEESEVDTRLNLVHCALTDYTEDGSYFEHLDRLRRQFDGYMDEAHVLRDQYRADLVALFVDDGEFCGIAYLMTVKTEGFAPFAFSVTTWYCAAGNKSFAHEIGHNQGCCHDHDNGCGDPIYGYAYGHRFFGDSGSQWRTVMAYAPGERIARFSNPDVLYDGRPTGVEDGPRAAHNARTINNTRVTVAGFRCGCPADLDGDGEVEFDDLLAVLDAWDNEGGPEDLDGSGEVDFDDLLIVLDAWGPCPRP